MLREYAVDPEALSRFGPMWTLLEQFGVNRGRVIAQYPNHWTRMVYDVLRAADCPDVERKRLEERLRGLKSALCKFTVDRPFEGKVWIEAALKANGFHPFQAILTNKDLANVPNILVPIDATNSNPLWRVDTPPIARTASAIASCLQPLGRISRELLFVDPYLCPDHSRLEVIRSILLSSGANERPIRRIELHVSPKAGDIKILAEAVKIHVLFDFPNPHLLRIYKWQKKPDGDRMHARYFLTERGGVQLDYGFDIGDPGETTDVHLMDSISYGERWASFQKSNTSFDLVCSIELHT